MSILEAVWKQSLYKRRLYVICGARLRTDLLDNRSLAMLLEISKGLIYQTLVSGQPLSRETGFSPWEEGRDTKVVLRDSRYGL